MYLCPGGDLENYCPIKESYKLKKLLFWSATDRSACLPISPPKIYGLFMFLPLKHPISTEEGDPGGPWRPFNAVTFTFGKL